METTIDRLELGHADVASQLVADESQVAGFGKVRCDEFLEAIGPEAELASEVRQRWHRNIADIAEGHVGASDQLGQLDVQGIQVAGKVDETSGLGQAIEIDFLQEPVLGDVKSANLVQGNALQVGQAGVGDLEVVSLGNFLAEIQRLQPGQNRPLDRADAGKGAHAERGEAFEGIQLELVADGLKARGRQLRQRASILSGETTRDLLDAVQSDGVWDIAAADLDVAIQGLAAGVAIGVALAGDLDGVAATAICQELVRCFFVVAIQSGRIEYSPEAKARLAAASAGRRYLMTTIVE